MEWFVSHYWGMPLRHFNDALRTPGGKYKVTGPVIGN